MTISAEEKVFKVFYIRYIRETGHAPWWPCLLTDQICFCHCCRGSPSLIVSAKLFSILTTGFRGEDV